MKKFFNYSTIISLTILFIFLSLLFLRMHFKLIYNGETKLSEIVDEAFNFGKKVINNDEDESAIIDYIDFYNGAKDYIDNYIESNPDAREDYLYTMVLVRNDIELIYQSINSDENSDLKPGVYLSHLLYLNNEHKSSLVFCIIFGTLSIISLSTFVIYLVKNKTKFEEIINHETSN